MAIPFSTSTSDYFHQDATILEKNWDMVAEYLRLQGYNEKQIEVYFRAYFYFVDHPYDFDGATMTEDLYDLLRLDLDAMLHDYQYLVYNVSASYGFTQLADKEMWNQSRKKGKSSWNVNARRVLLKAKSLIGFHLWAKYKAKRVMTMQNKIDFLMDIIILQERTN